MDRATLPHDSTQLLSRREVAEILLVSPKTLEAWARSEYGPRPLRIGRRRIAYRAGDIRDWLEHVEPAS